MHHSIPGAAHDLRDLARVVSVGLVRHRAHRRLGLARLYANRRHADLGQPGMHQAGLAPESGGTF